MSFTIEITDEYNVKIIDKSENKKEIKFIEINDLINILKSSQKVKNEKENLILMSPIFPSFEDISTLNYIVLDNDVQFITIKKDKGKHDFALDKKIYKQMSLPTLIFTFKIFKGVIVTGYVCCTKDIIVNSKSKVYYYPFGNVYLDSHICFGANSMLNHKITEYSQLHSMPSRFLLMPTTSFVSRCKYDMSSEKLCEHLTENEFDDNMLLNINDQTLEEYIKKIIKY